MTEVLSQEQVANVELDSENLFDDISFDTEGNIQDMPVEEETEVESEPVEEVVESTEPTPAEPFLKIKFNKEEYGLTQEEAVDLAEKGKNYERLYDKYSSLNGELDKLAKMNGLSIDEFLNSLNETQLKFEVNKEVNNLKAQYPNADEVVLQELAQERVNNRMNLQVQNAQKEQMEKEDANAVEARRQLDMFKSEYPNVDAKTLDKEVWNYVEKGYTLLESYNKWAKAKEAEAKPALEAKAKVTKLNEENKKKSLGTITNAGEIEGEDDFFAGLNSVLK